MEVVRLLAELGANVETPEEQRRHASLHRGAEGPRGGGEAAGRARGERRDAETTTAPRQPSSRRRGPRGGGEAAGRARGERRDADERMAARQTTSRRRKKYQGGEAAGQLGANIAARRTAKWRW